MILRACIAALSLMSAAYAADTTIPTMVIRPDPSPTDQILLERGHKAMDSYDDISAARLLLKPAAESGDVDAARRIAQTYDQVWLVEHHVIGVDGLANFDLAMYWYKRASQMGDKSDQNRYVQAERR